MRLCIQLGYFSGRRSERLGGALEKKPPAAPTTDGDDAERPGVRAGDRALLEMRADCANNLHLGGFFHENPMSQSLSRVILEVGNPVACWHTDQSHRLRRWPDSTDWLVEMIGGGFAKVLCSILESSLLQGATLDKIGLHVRRLWRSEH